MTVTYSILIFLFIAASLWTVMTASLLRAAIGLAITSAILAVIMFTLDAPWASVIELSVCAGLITVVFISAISLTSPATKEEELILAKKKLVRFAALPVIVVGLGMSLWVWFGKFGAPPTTVARSETFIDVRDVLWNTRQLDIAGQILIILAGIFGVIVLFKRLAAKGEEN